VKTITSKRFGHWELRCNGFSQHGLKAKPFIKMMMRLGKCSKKEAKKMMNKMMADECWYDATGKYKVVKSELSHDDPLLGKGCPFDNVTWLSIRINNGQDYLCDWRDFQAIKNDLCSPTREAIEIYPAEERLHDTDNVFHLWVLPEGLWFPLGWQARDVENGTEKSFTQRPLDK